MSKSFQPEGFIARLGNAQDWRCFHCGERMLKKVAEKQPNGQYDLGYTKEHVVPKKLGGFNRGNIVLAHLKCNSSRGHQPPGPHMMQRAREIWIQARTLRKERRAA